MLYVAADHKSCTVDTSNGYVMDVWYARHSFVLWLWFEYIINFSYAPSYLLFLVYRSCTYINNYVCTIFFKFSELGI